MKESKEIEIRADVTQLVKGYVMLMVAATTVMVVGGLLLYWYVEARYLNVSPFMSHLYTLLFVGGTFHLGAHSLFIFYFNYQFQNPNRKPAWLAELDKLETKVVELEHQLVVVKSRSPLTGSRAEEKSYIILRERDFIGELENRISHISSKLQDVHRQANTDATPHLAEILASLQDISELISKNREYLFIAA